MSGRSPGIVHELAGQMVKAAREQDWVVILTTQGGALFCLRCGQSYTPNLPAPVDIVAAVGKAFERTHRKCRPDPRGNACHFCRERGHEPHECTMTRPRTPEEWLRGPDTGTSSKTICGVMIGNRYVHGNVFHEPPLDPDDFGRCYRLLRAFPEWRARLPEVAAAYPEWAGLVDAWDELTALYEEERASGTAPKLYARMQELRGR